MNAVKYRVKELFWTVQGEGHNAGTPAVFVRFTGCNQWSGLEADRVRGTADCARWCDTDFADGDWFEQAALLSKIATHRGHAALVVFTGGEPALQLNEKLIADVSSLGFRCAVETNGSVDLPAGSYWKTVSPKGGRHPLKVTSGDELKLVYPQAGVQPGAVEHLAFKHFFLQPRNNSPEHTRACLHYIRANPKWRLSVQVHKYIGVR